jgi:tetratricopeptide (TPR) repeat protein
MEAIEKVKELEKVSGKKISFHADEAKMLTEAATGKLKSFTMTEAALIASGAVEPAERKKYLEQMDQLEAMARAKLDGAETVAERGERLLKFLHTMPMKSYELTQTDLTVVLDKGTFNCVSSAVLYNLMASRLGLNVKAMSIPAGPGRSGHAFSVLCDGDKQIPVETTNALGFDVFENMNRKEKCEVSELSLIAAIYYNRGVKMAHERKSHEALIANLCALCLDKTHASAINNSLCDLLNWERDLARAGKFQDGLEVLRVGLALAPKDTKMLQNRKALIHEIVMKEVNAKKFAEALSRIEEYKNLLGDKEQVRNVARMVFDTHANSYLRAKDWEKAAAVYVEGLKQHAGDSHLQNNLAVTYDSWARTFMQTNDWTGAIRVYEQGLAQLPGNGVLANNLRYCREQMKR